MIVVAVQDLNVDARLGHPPRDLAELPGFGLVQSLDEHVTLCENAVMLSSVLKSGPMSTTSM